MYVATLKWVVLPDWLNKVNEEKQQFNLLLQSYYSDAQHQF